MGFLEAFRPNLVANHVTELSPEWFAEQGFSVALLDLDNTLVEWHSRVIPEEIVAWVAALREAEVRMTILSNTHRPSRLRELAASLEIDHVAGVGKPAKAGYWRGLEQVGGAPEEAVVIGDQLLTDILGGNRCDLYTVWIRPLSRREFIGTRVVSRPIEGLIASALERRGWLQPVTSPNAANADSLDLR